MCSNTGNSICVSVRVCTLSQIKCEYMRNANNFKTLLLGAYMLPHRSFFLLYLHILTLLSASSLRLNFVLQLTPNSQTTVRPSFIAIHHISFENGTVSQREIITCRYTRAPTLANTHTHTHARSRKILFIADANTNLPLSCFLGSEASASH